MSQIGHNQSLAERAYRIRRKALRMGAVQGQGYIAQALGIADVLAVSYFHALNLRAEEPEWEERDRFFLSIGHYAIALYAALIEVGILKDEDVETYGGDDSRLPMSGMAAYTPGMEITGGSLGHGLPIAVGSCLALRRKQSRSFVYTLLSDGELDEGATWEAAMSAGSYRLRNLIAIVDINNMQADGPSTQQLNFEPLGPKFEAFNWFVQRVDGNDITALVAAFDAARSSDYDGPRAILCDTKMAKGVDFLEARERNHFLRVEPEEWDQALSVLDAGRPGAGSPS